MKKRLSRLYRGFLVICPALILLLAVTQFSYITSFNEHVYSVTDGRPVSGTTFTLADRGDSTSSWKKADYNWEGRVQDLYANTFDGHLKNNSEDVLNQWSLRLDIKRDCFINNAWCGIMEIHQNAGTRHEMVQTLDLRDYDLDKVKLRYSYDGDLLIPLSKGDYIIYYPSEKEKEFPVYGQNELTIGMIFYYFEEGDFVDYRMDFTYHRDFSYGPIYYIVLGLIALMLIGLVTYMISLQIYRDAEKQMENKKSGLSCMSDLYYASYIVELEKNRLIPVIEKEDPDMKRPESLRADEQLLNLIRMDSEEAYVEVVEDFCNLSTLPKRLESRNSVACEYISRNFGWCSMRFFAMDRIEGRSLDRVLFTIQIIEEEKQDMRAIESEILRSKNESMAQGDFLHSTAQGLMGPLIGLLSSNEQILQGGDDQSIHEKALDISRDGSRLLASLEKLDEYAELERDDSDTVEILFPLQSLEDRVRARAEELLKDTGIEFSTEKTDSVPERILGNEDRLFRALSLLIEDSLGHTKEGSIKLSIFGGVYGSRSHLVFSVRDTGDGLNDSDTNRLELKLAGALLSRMHILLNMVCTPGDGCEAYFELDRKINPAKGGQE